MIVRNAILVDLDGVLLERWTPEDFSPRPSPWMSSIRALSPRAICSNQGGIALRLAGVGEKYPRWPDVLVRVRAGMALAKIPLALVALHHPKAALPENPVLLAARAQDAHLPEWLLPGARGIRIREFRVPEGIIAVSWLPDWRKPAPGMLLEAARRLRCAPERCVFVGDEESDRDAANAAGMKFFDVREINGQMEAKNEGSSHC